MRERDDPGNGFVTAPNRRHQSSQENRYLSIGYALAVASSTTIRRNDPSARCVMAHPDMSVITRENAEFGATQRQ